MDYTYRQSPSISSPKYLSPQSNMEGLAKYSDDWRKIQDPKERRRSQNRNAQRKYRRKLKERAEAERSPENSPSPRHSMSSEKSSQTSSEADSTPLSTSSVSYSPRPEPEHSWLPASAIPLDNLSYSSNHYWQPIAAPSSDLSFNSPWYPEPSTMAPQTALSAQQDSSLDYLQTSMADSCWNASTVAFQDPMFSQADYEEYLRENGWAGNTYPPSTTA